MASMLSVVSLIRTKRYEKKNMLNINSKQGTSRFSHFGTFTRMTIAIDGFIMMLRHRIEMRGAKAIFICHQFWAVKNYSPFEMSWDYKWPQNFQSVRQDHLWMKFIRPNRKRQNASELIKSSNRITTIHHLANLSFLIYQFPLFFQPILKNVWRLAGCIHPSIELM